MKGMVAPEFIVKLDRPRRLIFDMRAVVWFQNRNPGALAADGIIDPDKLSVNPADLPPLLKMGLAWEDPEITEERIQDLLNTAIQEGKTTWATVWQKTISAVIFPFAVHSMLAGMLDQEIIAERERAAGKGKKKRWVN